MVDWWELCLLPQSELSPLKRGIQWKCLLVIIGCPVFSAVFYFNPHTENECSSAQSLAFLTVTYPISTSEAFSSKPCIHSFMLYAAVVVLFVFVVPWGHPGPLALVLFSMTVSAMAQWPFWIVLTIISTWDSLLAQLTVLPKWNPTSLVLPRGSPSLSNWHPKNKITSPEAKTTASVICSSRSSWNMLAINKSVHAWEGGGWSPPPSPKDTNLDAIACLIFALGCFVDAQAIKIV